MRVSEAEVRRQIVESVKSFYSCLAAEELLDGMNPPSKPKPRTFHSDNPFSRLSLSEALSCSSGGPFLTFVFPVFLNQSFFSVSCLWLWFSSLFSLSSVSSVLSVQKYHITFEFLFLKTVSLQGSSQPLLATGCSCWSAATWLRRCSSPWPPWRTSRA